MSLAIALTGTTRRSRRREFIMLLGSPVDVHRAPQQSAMPVMKILSMPKFGLEKARMRRRRMLPFSGDGPGRYDRGDRGHDRDRAFPFRKAVHTTPIS
jgi:hypothetical protein